MQSWRNSTNFVVLPGLAWFANLPFFLDTVCYGLLITFSQLIGLLSECVKNSNLDIPDPKGVYSIGYGDAITLASESCRFTSRGDASTMTRRQGRRG